VELLVALALLTAVAVVTAQLVIQSTRLMDTSARASRNPDLVLAMEWIRRDLYEARGVVGPGETWRDDPLVVTAQHGGWIAYAMVEGRLLRTDGVPGTSPAETRAVLNGVTGWRWRYDDSAAVLVELKAYANPHAHQNLGGNRSFRLERRTERLTFALRGRPGGAAW
jgi:hypothetical protein